jgi:hypothetical protein
MPCEAKHTKYQPTNDEWHCPNCGGDNDVFWIEENFGSDDCDLLHNEDVAVCVSCGLTVTGKVFASKLQKKHALVSCPCCKGKGLIHKDKAASLANLLANAE